MSTKPLIVRDIEIVWWLLSPPKDSGKRALLIPNLNREDADKLLSESKVVLLKVKEKGKDVSNR